MERASIETKVGLLLFEKFSEHLLSIGALDKAEIGNQQLLAEKVIEFAKSANYVAVTDHTEDLLLWANEFRASGNIDFAVLMYATYFEHALNNIIDHVVSKKGVSRKSTNSLIRSVNIAGKCSWLLEILELPSFNAKHAKSIVRVSEERNAFVHYKWGEREEGNARKEELVAEAKKTVTYMKRYTSKVFFKGQKRKLKKTLTKSSTRPSGPGTSA